MTSDYEEDSAQSDEQTPLDSRISVSTETRRRLKLIKAKRDHASYDELLQELLGAVER